MSCNTCSATGHAAAAEKVRLGGKEDEEERKSSVAMWVISGLVIFAIVAVIIWLVCRSCTSGSSGKQVVMDKPPMKGGRYPMSVASSVFDY